MRKESIFLIYCMERYRHFKGLSGADVAKTFDKYVSMGISPNILNRCTRWETTVLCRILMITSAASTGVSACVTPFRL